MTLVMIMRFTVVAIVGVIIFGWIISGIIADDKFDRINYYEFMANQWRNTPRGKYFEEKLRQLEK